MVAAAILDKTPRQALLDLWTALGLEDDELAQALGANRRTLQRWRAGTAYPQQAARARLAALLRLSERVGDTFTSREAGKRWFRAPSHFLGGLTPAEAARAGRTDRVDEALEALDSGIFI